MKSLKRRLVAIHGIDAFNHDPWCAATAVFAPGLYPVLEGLCIIVPGANRFGAARTDARMGAGMDEFVIHDQVARLGQGGKCCQIGHVAAAEIDHARGTEMCCGFGFKRLVFRMVAAQ
ncbi:hypothetical protein BCH_01153 [Brucella sp. 191011898]|nr:hypothetical protein BCH_01153 [Brucella sp. 191011898]